MLTPFVGGDEQPWPFEGRASPFESGPPTISFMAEVGGARKRGHESNAHRGPGGAPRRRIYA